MIVAPGGQAPVCIDFNVWAPLEAVDTYLRVTTHGPSASVIPNVVAGLSAALRAFGSMSWAQVIEPAIAPRAAAAVSEMLDTTLRPPTGPTQ